MDASPVVQPFVDAAADGFGAENPDVSVRVGTSEAAAGFGRLCTRRVDVVQADRPMTPDEVAVCRREGVAYRELAVARYAVAVVTNPGVDVECMTLDELELLWTGEPGVASLPEVRADLPDVSPSLYSPPGDSSSFELFTQAVAGRSAALREDLRTEADDDALVRAVASDPAGLGYVGLMAFERNQEELNSIAVDSGEGCVAPSVRAVQDGSYVPLSRIVYLYPRMDALRTPAVRAFLRYVARNSVEVAQAAEAVPLTADEAANLADEVGQAVQAG